MPEAREPCHASGASPMPLILTDDQRAMFERAAAPTDKSMRSRAVKAVVKAVVKRPRTFWARYRLIPSTSLLRVQTHVAAFLARATRREARWCV